MYSPVRGDVYPPRRSERTKTTNRAGHAGHHTPMPKARILVIDDEAAIRDSLRMTLEYEGYEFVGAATGQEGLALVEREAFDLVLLDVKMPGMDGLDVLGRLRAMNETLPVVMIS